MYSIEIYLFFFFVVVKVIGFCSCCVVTVEGSFLFCFVFLFRWVFFCWSVILLKFSAASFLSFQIVNLIEETGHFHITNTTFDFDLCSLDKTTVRKLQSYLETSGTSWGFSIWMHQKLFSKWNVQNDATKMGKNKTTSFSFIFH